MYDSYYPYLSSARKDAQYFNAFRRKFHDDYRTGDGTILMVYVVLRKCLRYKQGFAYVVTREPRATDTIVRTPRCTIGHEDDTIIRTPFGKINLSTPISREKQFTATF